MLSINQPHHPVSHAHNRPSDERTHSSALGTFQQETSRAGRVEYSVFGYKQTASHALAQIRFKPFQVGRIEDLHGNSATGVIGLFAANLGHLFFVGRDPNGPALLVLNIIRQFGTQLLPKPLRVTRQRELCFRVVHYDDVAHSCGSRATPNDVAIHNCNPHALAGASISTGCSYDSGAHD